MTSPRYVIPMGNLQVQWRPKGSWSPRRKGPRIDPVALLRREHEKILKQLDMIEAIIGPQPRGPHRNAIGDLAEADRFALREIFRFFTSRVGVHYRREAILCGALRRTFHDKLEGREPFANLLVEHRLLRSDAAGIVKKLKGKIGSDARADNVDPWGIRTFIRQYRKHIEWEEQVLFVLAEIRLTPAEKIRVCHGMLKI